MGIEHSLLRLIKLPIEGLQLPMKGLHGREPFTHPLNALAHMVNKAPLPLPHAAMMLLEVGIALLH